jgi:hypothetical protein
MGTQGRMGLPLHIDRVTLSGRRPQSPETRLYAVVTPNSSEGGFDSEIVDAKGNCYMQLKSYRTVALPNAVDAERLKALQAAMSLAAVAA